MTSATREQSGRQPGRVVGADPEVQRPVVHELADGGEGALGDQAALGDDEDARPEPLDLVEHVARDDDRLALLAEPAEQLDRPQPLAGVEPFERFVEDEEVGVVDDGLGQLHPLAHALGVRGERAGIPGVELDGCDRPTGRLARAREMVEDGGEAARTR